MKLLIVAVTFGVSIGLLFLFSKGDNEQEGTMPTALISVSSSASPSATAPAQTKKPVATQSPKKLPTATPVPSQTPSATLTTTPAPSSYQIEVISITSPVKQNSIAEIKIKTKPEAQCDIKVTLPSGGQSAAKGLEPKTTSTAGSLTWSWRINWNTKPGIATIEIACTKDGQNFSKTIQMEIVQ